MKKNYFLLLLLFPFWANAQNLLLNVDGDQPNPLSDKTGLHTVLTHGQPFDSLGFLVFKNETPIPQIHNYLSIDSLYNAFDVNANWTVEFKVYTGDPGEDHYFLDWGSTSLTGHMRFAYDEDRGLHFSDRPVNGQNGFIVADSTQLPQNTWVAVKFEKLGFTYNLYRNGVLMKTASNPATLTTPTLVTIAYSEDDRPFHNWYLMDDVQIKTNQPLGVEANGAPGGLRVLAIGNNGILMENNTERPLQVSVQNLLGQGLEQVILQPHQRLIRTMSESNQLLLIGSAGNKTQKVFVY
jgi:hypothetical protein